MGTGAGLKTSLAPTSEVRTVAASSSRPAVRHSAQLVSPSKAECPKTLVDRTVHTKSEVAACTPHRFRKPLIFI